MKKNHFILISLIGILGISLVACSTASPSDQQSGGEVVGSDTTSTQSPSPQPVPQGETDVPPATPTEDFVPKPTEELPPIPVVQFGSGSDWFRPTPPEEIQLTSGGLQLFEFSAVW